jgi:hypothetical protein
MHNNGQEVQTINDIDHQIRQIARFTGTESSRHDMPPPSREPFGEKAHDLMHQTIDQVCSDWVHQLQEVRKNSERLEQLVLEQATKVKSSITQLYALGKAAAAEAQRGEEVNQKLMRELETLAEEQPGD